LKAAGVDNQVTIVIGPAAESITKLSPEVPYDLAFIDADKPNNPIYFFEAKRLVRKGGVIVRLALLSLSSLIDFLKYRLWTMSSVLDT
jgi:predicted O-methyltransferase YrrM